MARVLFCGQSSYPRQDSATANRYRAIAEMTADLGHEVIFVNRYPPLRPGEEAPVSQFEFINVSGLIRSPSWLYRQMLRLIAILSEAIKIFQLAQSGRVEYINVYSALAWDSLFYYLLSKMVGAKCIQHIVEQRSEIANRKGLARLNDIVSEIITPRLFENFIAISASIRENIVAANPNANIIIIPPVCRFDAIDSKPKSSRQRPYFLYCASLAYEDVAWFVIESFFAMQRQDVDLVLVLNGVLSNRIRDACAKNKSIQVMTKLDYEVLIGMYKGAHALLIPLRNNIQDSARYPQKITEYLASGRPIISCRVGEVGKHFSHGVNALLSENYDVAEYSELMRMAVDEVDLIENIAKQGYCLGREMFDMQAQKDKLMVLLT